MEAARAEFLYQMRWRFLRGLEGAFIDYRKIDADPQWDDHERLARETPERVRRRDIGQLYLYMRNFMGGFYGASEIFLRPRKTKV